MLWKNAIVALIGQCSILAVSAAVHKRIVNGSEAEIGEFPYMVSIQTSRRSHNCGGVLLDSTTVLTAAHCTYEGYSDFVRAGSLNQTAGGFYVDVLSRKTHPNYQPKTVNGVYEANDIAILKLKQRIRESDTIAYAKLPTNGSVPELKSTPIAAGWGSMKHVGDDPSVVLRKVPLSILPREDCRKLDSEVGSRDTVLCASGAAKQGVCKNDSGGPLVDEKTRAIIGLASWIIKPPGYVYGEKEECGNAPALFTRVSGYVSFILENLGETGQTEDATLEDPKQVEQEARDRMLQSTCLNGTRDYKGCMRAAFRCTGQVKKDASMDEFLGCVNRMQACVELGIDTDECRAKAKKCAEENPFSPGNPAVLAECLKKDL